MALDLAAVRAYIAVPATVLPDADLQRMWDTAIENQAQRCNIPEPLPAGLEQAQLRRVQREVAAKNLPLGLVGSDGSEFPLTLPQYDALIEQHEKGYRIQVIA